MFRSDDACRLRVEAARHLEGLLKPLERSEAEEWIERVVEGVAKRNLDSAVVDKDTLVSVVQVRGEQGPDVKKGPFLNGPKNSSF